MSTKSTYFLPAFASPSESGAFVLRTPTLVKPSGDGIVAPPFQGYGVENLLVVKPYGSNANDEAFAFQVIGWHLSQSTGLWEPCLILQSSVILGNIARGDNFFDADTVTAVAGDTETSRVVSPGENRGSAYVVADIIGFELIEFQVDLDTAASAQLLYRLVS